MRLLSVLLLISCYLLVSVVCLQQVAQNQPQRILRRVIKSTPTATNLTRVKSVTITQVDATQQDQSSPVSSFGKRDASASPSITAASLPPTSSAANVTTTTTTTPASSKSTTVATDTKSKRKPSLSPVSRILTTISAASNNQQETISNQTASSTTQSTSAGEVEILSVASSVPVPAAEAPANIVAAESAAIQQGGDLSSSSSSTIHHSIHSEESASTSDFLRSSSSSANYATKGGSSSNKLRFNEQQQQQQQQNFFYPSQLRQQQGTKTAQRYETKTSFFKPTTTTTTTTTPRPAPIIQEYNQDYQQQSEQYVEQQQQVDYGQAPLGQAEPFAFDFKMDDNQGNGQYRKEESDKNGVVRGSYGYTDANGIYRHVEYVADVNGFRANIKSNEPGLQGETMPASIQMAHSSSTQNSQPPTQKLQSSSNQIDNSWTSSSELAPTFESSHRPERIRLPRNNLPQVARFAPAPIRPSSIGGAEPEFGAHI